MDFIQEFPTNYMTLSRIHFSSESGEHGTPEELFAELNAKFKFTLDPCATKQNALCKKFYTKKENGLIQSWTGERVFVNPPYGRGIIDWVSKCVFEQHNGAGVIVLLVPARTDTKWFDLLNGSLRIYFEFLKGRLTFKGNKDPAPFPSMLVYFL